MNKIECKIQSNLFEDFPVGTIFFVWRRFLYQNQSK